MLHFAQQVLPSIAASHILLAVRKKKNRIILGTDAKVVNAIRQLFPSSFPTIIHAIFSKAMFKSISFRNLQLSSKIFLNFLIKSTPLKYDISSYNINCTKHYVIIRLITQLSEANKMSNLLRIIQKTHKIS